LGLGAETDRRKTQRKYGSSTWPASGSIKEERTRKKTTGPTAAEHSISPKGGEKHWVPRTSKLGKVTKELTDRVQIITYFNIWGGLRYMELPLVKGRNRQGSQGCPGLRIKGLLVRLPTGGTDNSIVTS